MIIRVAISISHHKILFHLKQYFLLYLPLIGFCGSVTATEKQDTVIVTATRTAQIADESLAPVIVIDQDEIEASTARDLGDLLRTHAGLELGRNGGTGQLSSLFVRGTDSNQVMVLIDGVKMNASTIKQPAINNISLDLIERIEVVKGPRSSLYGSEAIGGVVNIITKRGIDANRSTLSIAVGDNNSNKVTVDSHITQGYGRMGISASADDTDGIISKKNVGDKPHKHRQRSVNAYLGINLSNSDFELSHWQADTNSQYHGSDSQTFAPAELDQDLKNRVSTLKLILTDNDSLIHEIKLSRTEAEIIQNQSDDIAYTQRDTIDYLATIFWSNNQQTNIGLSAIDEHINSLSFGSPNSGDSKDKALVIQHQARAGNHNTVAAIRYWDYDVDYKDVMNINDHDISYNIDYGYSIGKITLTAGSGTGYRVPDLLDLSSIVFAFPPLDDPATIEEATNYEIGLRYRASAGHRFNLALFQNDIDNLYVWNPTTSQIEVVAKTRIRGLELTHTYETSDWATRIEASIKDPRDLVQDTLLARRAKRTFSISYDHKMQNGVWTTQWLASSERNDGSNTLGGYALLNTSYKQIVNKKITLSTKIENLLNKEYELVTDYNTHGRFILIELKYST